MSRRSTKPQVIVNCVASHYAGPSETIIEYTFPDGTGGLISFLTLEDGAPSVSLYRHDPTVKIMTPAATPDPVTQAAPQMLAALVDLEAAAFSIIAKHPELAPQIIAARAA